MIPRGRGSSSYRGSSYPPSHRGGRGRGKQPEILVQHGNRRLIAMNLLDDKDFQEYLETKKQNQASSSENNKVIPSFASIVGNEDSEHNNASYHESKKQEVILLLEDNDYKWLDEPWTLMRRYMEEDAFPSRVYKSRNYYENILINNGCDIQHYSSGQPEVYNFSKFIIKKIITVRDWGMSPLKTKEFTFGQNNSPIKYNFWDYIDAFGKVLLYENPRCRHSWFIKICAEVYKIGEIPVWLAKWWQEFGTTEDILPEDLKEKYFKWVKISPKVSEYEDKEFYLDGLYSLLFFMEFSIPYIWKWSPVYGFTEEHIPCLKRNSFSKFWDKMMKIDPETKLIFGYDTVCCIDKQIKVYEEQQKNSSFEYVMDKIRAKSMGSRQEIINAYLEEMKKDLMNFEDDTQSHQSTKTDVSMATSSHNLFQDSQEEEEPNMEDIIEAVKSYITDNLLPKEKGESSHSGDKDKE